MNSNFAPPSDVQRRAHGNQIHSLRLRTASILDDHGIRTALDLRIALLTKRIWALPQFGMSSVDECQRAIRLIEGRVLDWQI